MSVKRLCLITALVCFVLALFPVEVPIGLVPLGLALWVLASLL